eukprot:6561969-Pyramimonas_sp.AAC.1
MKSPPWGKLGTLTRRKQTVENVSRRSVVGQNWRSDVPSNAAVHPAVPSRRLSSTVQAWFCFYAAPCAPLD